MKINFAKLIGGILLLLGLSMDALAQDRPYTAPTPSLPETRPIQDDRLRNPPSNNTAQGNTAPSPKDEWLVRPNPQSISPAERCRDQPQPPPDIQVTRFVSDGGWFSDNYILEGRIHGACIEEAGYYENSGLVEPIRFPLDGGENEMSFRFKVRAKRRGEIAVRTFDGQRRAVSVDALSAEQSWF